MVKTPNVRHSKTKRDPVTIELGAGEVSRIDDKPETPAADVPDEAAAAAPQPEPEQPAVRQETAQPEDASEAPSAQSAPEGYSFENDRRETSFEEKKTEPRAESPLPPPPATQKRGGVSTIAAGLIGGLVALAGGGALQFAGVLGNPGASGGDSAAVTALQTEIAALKEQIAGLPAGGDNGAGAKVDALSGALDQLKTDVGALKSAVEQGGAGDGAAVAALDAKVKQIETAIASLNSAGGGASEAALTAVGDRITALEGQVKAAADATAAADSRVAALEQSVASLTGRVDAQASQPKVALAIATSALKQALERGGPFAAELETFAAIAPNAPELAALRSYAEKGVSTRAELQEDMPQAAQAMIAAAMPVDQNAGFFQRLMSSAESLVTVRPIGEVEGAGVPETVARMEVAVNSGDLAKAATEYETLPDPVKAVGKDFADRIKARLEVEKLVDQAIAGAMKA